MTLTNPGFELGSTPHPNHGNIYEPTGWKVYWQSGEAAHEPGVFYAQPEVQVIAKQPPYLDPLRIAEGQQAVKLFTFYRIHDAGLFQRVKVKPGSKVTFTYEAHAWSSTNDDPHTSDTAGEAWKNFTFLAGIDPYGETDPFDASVVWGQGAHIYDAYEPVPPVTVTAQADYVTVFIRSKTLWRFKHNDAYFDACELIIEEPEEPTNVPPPGGYNKEYWVVPADIAQERRQDIYKLAGAEQKTVGPSADDSRSWATELIDAGRTVKAVVWDRKTADQSNWLAYYADREPRIEVEFRGSEPPPGGGAPPPIQHYSGNFIGLQHAYPKQDWDKYVLNASPTVTKTFEISTVIQAKKIQPEMLTVWRKFVDNYDTGHMLNDGRVGAQRLLDLYTADINAYSQNEGVPVWDILGYVDVIESLNETIPSNNPTVIKLGVDFDLYFSEALHARYGALVKAGLLNVAVGNPFESEVPMLLPCARESHEGRAVLGYHGYWMANKSGDWLVEYYQHHAFRWTEWDKVFTANGLYPTYYLGECGICYAYWGDDGKLHFDSGSGWKSCGNFENYIDQLGDFNALIDIWNAANQGRCYGATLFIYGGWGWEDFEPGVGDLHLLADTMKDYV